MTVQVSTLQLNTTAATPQIRTQARPYCALCGGSGEFIHRKQMDRLFGALGTWDFKRCSNSACQLIWLDPTPLEEDIGKAYTFYYTHRAPQIKLPSQLGMVRRFYRLLKQAYLADRYGYDTGGDKGVAGSLGKLLYLLPHRRRRADEEVRFLHWVDQGRLLDVGCGSGQWLSLVAQMGWQVEGVDFDEQSVNLARQQGLSVHLGSLEQQNFPSESFHALAVSHVIEHVPDPIRTLTECARILKPGGQLVLYTPNASSLGHRLFKQNWRGLEPPRHLHLFGPAAMRTILNGAGLRYVSMRTRNSLDIWKQTFALWAQPFDASRGFAVRSVALAGPYLMTFLEGCWLVADAEAGEWLSVTAQKV
jgi:SAM-dependent methyltransferase